MMKRWIAGLTVLALLFALCGCELIPGRSRETTSAPTLTETTETTQTIPETQVTENATEEELEEISAYVTEAVHETLPMDDSTFTFVIPMIVCDSDGIAEINNEIYELYYNKVYTENVVEAVNEYGLPGLCEINYMWGKCGDYLSLVVYFSPYASSGTEFDVWNIDLREGKRVEDEKIVEIFDYDMDSFYVRAGDVMGSYCFDTTYSFVPEEMLNEFYRALTNTIVIYNVHKAQPYIGEDGMLWMIAQIGSIAGADYYAQPIPFETYPVSQEYLDYIS